MPYKLGAGAVCDSEYCEWVLYERSVGRTANDESLKWQACHATLDTEMAEGLHPEPPYCQLGHYTDCLIILNGWGTEPR